MDSDTLQISSYFINIFAKEKLSAGSFIEAFGWIHNTFSPEFCSTQVASGIEEPFSYLHRRRACCTLSTGKTKGSAFSPVMTPEPHCWLLISFIFSIVLSRVSEMLSPLLSLRSDDQRLCPSDLVPLGFLCRCLTFLSCLVANDVSCSLLAWVFRVILIIHWSPLLYEKKSVGGCASMTKGAPEEGR